MKVAPMKRLRRTKGDTKLAADIFAKMLPDDDGEEPFEADVLRTITETIRSELLSVTGEDGNLNGTVWFNGNDVVEPAKIAKAVLDALKAAGCKL